jgi:sec-independent protein translocase protein TatA
LAGAGLLFWREGIEHSGEGCSILLVETILWSHEMPDLGPAELIIVFLVVVMIFGGTRLAELGGSLGKGIKEFKKAVNDDEPLESSSARAPSATAPVNTITCVNCSTENTISARFCTECGEALHAPDASVTA